MAEVKNTTNCHTAIKGIYNQGWTVIGDVAFQLPKSGNVTVEVRIGFNNDTGVGHTSKSYNVHIYPF